MTTLEKSKQEKLVLWFQDLTKDDIPSVGGKNANLGEMTRAKIPIPPGFAVTAHAYKKFITEEKIDKRILQIIKETVTDPDNPKQYDTASKKIRLLVENA